MQIIPGLEPLPSSASERRTHHRAILWEKVLILAAIQPQRPIDAFLRDVSHDGLGIVCQKAIPLGQEFRLVLDSTLGGRQYFACLVVAARRLGENLYGVGGQFTLETRRLWEPQPGTHAA